MVFNFPRCNFRTCCLAAAFGCLWGTAESRAQQPAKKAAQQQQKQVQQQQKKQAELQRRQQQLAADQEMNVKEAALLKEAYIYLAMANHNYNGHRGAAMKKIEEAAAILDKNILRHGNNGQKLLATQQDIVAARTKFLASITPTVHEAQALSDQQMQAGLNLLLKLQPVLLQRKQDRVLGLVTKAIEQINYGLYYRVKVIASLR